MTPLPECLFMLPNRIPQLVAIDPRPFMEGMEVALLVGGDKESNAPSPPLPAVINSRRRRFSCSAFCQVLKLLVRSLPCSFQHNW